MRLFERIMSDGGLNKIELFPDMAGNVKGPWFGQTYHKMLARAEVLVLDVPATEKVTDILLALSPEEKIKMLRQVFVPTLPLFVEAPYTGRNSVQGRRGILILEGRTPGAIEFHTFVETKKRLVLQNTSFELDLDKAKNVDEWDKVFSSQGGDAPSCMFISSKLTTSKLATQDLNTSAMRDFAELIKVKDNLSEAELMLLSLGSHILTVDFMLTVFWLLGARIIKRSAGRKALWSQRRKTGAFSQGTVDESEIVLDLLRVKEIRDAPPSSGPRAETGPRRAHTVWAHKCVSKKTGKTWLRRAHVRGQGEPTSKPRTMRHKEPKS